MDEDLVLRTILEGTATEIGAGFFRSLVRNVCRALGTAGAWVTEYLPEQRRLRSQAFWYVDHYIEGYEYAIAGTPCEPVIDDLRLCHVPDRVVELFPDDPDLAPLNAVSYMGIPLLDGDRTILGHLALIDTRPMPAEPKAEAVFRIFADRAAAELRRLRAEEEVVSSEASLRRLVDGAMDAIVELDAELTIRRTNPAARAIFRSGEGALERTSFARLLEPESFDKLGKLALALRENHTERAAWIGGGLQARRSDGSSFPAEATLSLSGSHRGETFFTLVLRDVNERIEAERALETLAAEADYLREELAANRGRGGIAGDSPAIRRLRSEIAQVADTGATVLISGETGTGKELVAQAIHEASARGRRPLVKVNCAAIPETLIESEFFGHEAGAFTGATRRREGRFALADGGTLFLDEIGELPVALQPKLLRALQEGEFEPVGSSKTRRVDVRVVAATNRDLLREVAEGRFREDLYYRMAVFPIHVPPLREREEDVVLLAESFAAALAARMRRSVAPLTESCKRRLRAYDWPGNVRELQNVIERAVITARDGRMDLDRALPPGALAGEAERAAREPGDDARILTVDELRLLEIRNIERALQAAGGKIAGPGGASERLGLRPSTLASRMKALGIKR